MKKLGVHEYANRIVSKKSQAADHAGSLSICVKPIVFCDTMIQDIIALLVLSGPLLLHGMYEFYFFISKCIL